MNTSRILLISCGAIIIAGANAAALAQPANCPANSLFSQSPDNSCVAGTSEAGTPFRRWERFHGVGGPITGLRWFGLAARPQSGTFVACEEEDHTFEITIAQDVAGAPGPVQCTYTLVATRTATSLICGENDDSPVRYQYDVVLPTPCILVRGWISIVGMGSGNCWFLWYRSATGDGTSRCEGCANLSESFDLSLCLLGTPGGVTGACCNEVTAACADNVDMNDCTDAAQRFTPNTACVDITPSCGQLVGPCCRVGAPCSVIPEVTCQGLGGQWLSPDSNCEDCPAIGACCQGGSHCSLTEGPACLDEGHTWLGADTTCSECPALPACPSTDVLFSHNVADPLAEPTAYTSDTSASLRMSEYFSEVTGPVTALTWWGLDLRRVGNGWVECTETDPTFSIHFKEDAAGVPGTLVYSTSVLASRTPTGHTYHGAQLNEYHATLPTPSVLTRGWVSIAGMGDPLCWFLWMASPTGSHKAHCEGCAAPSVGANLAVCLHGTPGGVFGACCNETTAACNDNVEIDDCAELHQRFSADGLCASLSPPCGVILGACCFAQFSCFGTTESDCQTQGGLWLGGNSQCNACPCIINCPTGGQSEGEPLCVTGYNDQYNAGCTSSPHHFTPISLGETICGVAGFYETGVNYQPDQDWYEIQIPAAMGWSVQVTAELPLRVEIREFGEGCPGNPIAFNQSPALCHSQVIGVFSENPGTHWIRVAAYVGNDNSACGKRYSLEIISPYGCIPGDMNQDLSVDGIDIAIFTECLTTGTSPFLCLCGDMNFDGVVNPDDIPLFVASLIQP